ncbi:MAG TPA: KH domain-containing protein [Myxococcota bacterium]
MSAHGAAAELVAFVAKAIVNDADAVKVHEPEPGLLELETAPDDRGRVIGRQGRVAKAMRVVLAASAVGADCRLEIVD